MIKKKTLAATFLVRAIMAVSTFGLFVLSSRYLGAGGRGTISLFIANLTIVQLLSEIIFGPGYIYTAQKISFRKLFTAGFIWSFLCSIFVSVILWQTKLESTDLFPFLMINSFLFAIITGINYQLQAIHYTKAFNTINLIQSLSSLFIAWYLLSQEATTQRFCIALLCSYILTSFAGFYFLFNHYSTTIVPDTPQSFSILDSFKTGLTAQYSNFLNFVNTRIGFYLIFIILGDIKELGVFAAAATIAESVWIISHTLATWLYPRIASSGHSDETIQLTLSYAYFTFWYSLAALLIWFAIPEDILLYLFGKDFTGIKNYLLLLMPGTLLLAYGKIFWNYFSGTGSFYINNYASLVSVLIAIVCSIPLMYSYSIYGVAISTSISYIVYAGILVLVFAKQHKLSWKKILPSFRLLP